MMAISKFLDPKNDLAFKRIFGTERNKDILIHFLNDIFTHTFNPIEDVTFLKTVQDPAVAAQRVSIVDILCEDTKGERFIIEMQVAKEQGFEKRAQYYAAKAYIDQREKGTDFQDLKRVTFLAILDFVLFPQKENYISNYHLMDVDTHEQDLKDFSFSFLQLPKFTKNKDQLKTMTEKWAYFFKHAARTKEEDLESIIGCDLIIQKAYEELNRFSWSAEELRTYDSIDMKKSVDKAIKQGAFQDGLEKGREEGREEGAHQASYNIALNLLKVGISIDQIAQATGLSQDEIAHLQK